jgi:hypothetical protein
VVFGGYDGRFRNDMHYVDLLREEKMKLSRSTLQHDFATLCADNQFADVVIRTSEGDLPLHKGVLLHRCTKVEVESSLLLQLFVKPDTPPSAPQVVQLAKLYPALPPEGMRKTTWIHLLEFLYAGAFVAVSAGFQARIRR